MLENEEEIEGYVVGSRLRNEQKCEKVVKRWQWRLWLIVVASREI